MAAALAALPLDVLQLYVRRAARRRAAGAVRRAGLARRRGRRRAPTCRATAQGADGFVIEAEAAAGRDAAGRQRGGARLVADRRLARAGALAAGRRADPGNVAAAIRASGATAVDVSSGVERARGVKDPALIAAFVAAARAEVAAPAP